MSYREMPEPPLHIADGRRDALVGPLVRFRGGQQMPVRHAPPFDTRDPRYTACTDHHLACDCREAEQNENLHEHRAELREIDRAIAAAIEGHPTQVFVDNEERPDLECQCVGCKVARITRRGLRWGTNSRSIKLTGRPW